MPITIITLLFSSISTFALSYHQSVPENLGTALSSDIAKIENIRGDRETPLHAQIFGKLDGRHYLKIFNNAVSIIAFNNEPCNIRGAVACAYREHSAVIISDKYLTLDPSLKNIRFFILLHEAFHFYKNINDHVNCPSPFQNDKGEDYLSIFSQVKLEGRPFCDNDLMAAYSLSTIILYNIGRYCTNCDTQLKRDAMNMAKDQLIRVINPSVKSQLINDMNSK